MKKTLQKIFLSIGVTLLMLLFNTVNAATYSVTPSNTNIQVGDSVTVTVKATAGAWGININSGGLSGDTTGLAGQTDTTSNKNVSKTYTFTANKAGTYTINVSGDITDFDTDQITKISKPITVTVAEKTQPTQQQNQQQTQQQQPTQQQNQQQAATYKDTNQTLYIINNGTNVRKEAVSGAVITSLKAGTSVQVTGTGSNGWSRVNINGQTGYIKTSLLTSTKPTEEQQKEEEKQEDKKEEKSTNKALKDLVIENYKLSPEFSSEVTKYSLEVKGDVDKLGITPVLQDDKSKFTIEGNENLKVGNNIVKVTVTAEDGTTRIYTIAVSKTNEGSTDVEMIRLKDLKVNNLNLQPSFSPETTNYVIEMDDPSTFKIADIVATPEDETVDVSISESVNTDKSEKIITIMLEDKEGTKTGVYQITVKKASSNPIDALKNNKDNKIYYILGGIIAVLVVLIIIVIILLKKTSNSDDFDGYEANADELSDDYDYSLKNAIDEANNKPQQQYDEIVENSNIKSQILNSTPKDYDVFKDNDSFDETQVYDNFDSEIKEKKKGKHF